MDARNWRFPTTCPKCERMTGNPTQVAKWVDDDVTIAVECEACGYDWEMTGHARTLFPPRPDRPLTIH